jgi:hypothetical protein
MNADTSSLLLRYGNEIERHPGLIDFSHSRFLNRHTGHATLACAPSILLVGKKNMSRTGVIKFWSTVQFKAKINRDSIFSDLSVLFELQFTLFITIQAFYRFRDPRFMVLL